MNAQVPAQRAQTEDVPAGHALSAHDRQAVRAAYDAVRAHCWETGRPISAHIAHRFHSGCAVCVGDIEAMLVVANPFLSPARPASIFANRADQENR